jgi:glycosyltransferase involved in cell wall biosynthesis
MENRKKVSVVMCTYNGEKYVREQLDSILNQTYPVCEIIVQDDCSTDGTWNILQEYEQKFPVIKCFRNESNLYVDMNFKTAFWRATGDFIAPSDQDDIWLPHKIETLVKLIDNKMLAFSVSKIMFSAGGFGHYHKFAHSLEGNLWRRLMPGHACLFPNSMLPYIKLSENINISYDLAICLIGYALDSYIFINEELQLWRRHENAVSKTIMTKNNESIQTNINKDGKFQKLLYSIKELLLRHKSRGIAEYFGAQFTFLSRLKCKKHILIFCRSMACQTLGNYILAAIICTIYRKRFFEQKQKLTFKQELIFAFFAFRSPFNFWHEYHQCEDNL